VGREAQIRIDLSSPEPAYRQVAAQVRALIVEGALSPGDSLPAVRRLAIDLGVHFNTVAEAYRQLAEEGLLEVSHGRAARVAARRAGGPDRSAARQLRTRLRHLVAEMRASGMTTEKVRAEMETLLDGDRE
jgi:DNA-binding transcriptional regulator YhcF (GntR family)